MKLDPLQYRDEVLPTDVALVRRIVESSGFFSTAEVEVAVELVEARLSQGTRSGYSFVFADAGGQTVGYSCYGPIACTECSFDLYWIAVEAQWRGLGLGRELLSHTERRVKALGGRRVYVETSSRRQYLPTRAFYLGCGYHEEAILKDFYSPGDDKVIYIRALDMMPKIDGALPRSISDARSRARDCHDAQLPRL